MACPVKYRWTYVDPRGKWYLKSRQYYSFGLSLHRALERFHDSGDTGVQTVYQAVAAVEESWIDAGYSSAEEMAEAMGEGKQIISEFLEAEQEVESHGKPLWVEKTLRYDMGVFDLVGRLDRVDELEDGSLEILDYKSGRSHVKTEDVATDLAMACYQLLVRRTFPDRTALATIVSLRSRERASFSLSNEELADFEFQLRELGERILNHDYYEMEPIGKMLCADCDFVQLCLKHPEFRLESSSI